MSMRLVGFKAGTLVLLALIYIGAETNGQVLNGVANPREQPSPLNIRNKHVHSPVKADRRKEVQAMSDLFSLDPPHHHDSNPNSKPGASAHLESRKGLRHQQLRREILETSKLQETLRTVLVMLTALAVLYASVQYLGGMDAFAWCGDGPSKLVFVTSEEYGGKLSFQDISGRYIIGVDGADAKCQALAVKAMNINGTFKAWMSDWPELSDVSESPNTRFNRSPCPYILNDNNRTVIARNYADLVDGKINAPIAYDENGLAVTESNNIGVWTGTKANGDPLECPNGGRDPMCYNWRMGDSYHSGTVGRLFQTDVGWSEGIQTDQNTCSGQTEQCNSKNRLYCFEQ